MEDANGTDRLYLAEFHPDGSGGLVERANPLPFSVAGQRSALPSIAVTDNGTIAVQYDTFTPSDGEFHVHLATSADQGQSFTDQDLYDFTASGIPFLYTGGNRLLGDYQDLIAVGNTVYGTFAGRGNVTIPSEGIDTTDKIDPFFYSVTLPEGSLTSLAPSLGAGATGSTGGSSTGDSVTGSAMGAAITGDRTSNLAAPSRVPATALGHRISAEFLAASVGGVGLATSAGSAWFGLDAGKLFSPTDNWLRLPERAAAMDGRHTAPLWPRDVAHVIDQVFAGAPWVAGEEASNSPKPQTRGFALDLLHDGLADDVFQEDFAG
jgi:hypothetical protein